MALLLPVSVTLAWRIGFPQGQFTYPHDANHTFLLVVKIKLLVRSRYIVNFITFNI